MVFSYKRKNDNDIHEHVFFVLLSYEVEKVLILQQITIRTVIFVSVYKNIRNLLDRLGSTVRQNITNRI